MEVAIYNWLKDGFKIFHLLPSLDFGYSDEYCSVYYGWLFLGFEFKFNFKQNGRKRI